MIIQDIDVLCRIKCSSRHRRKDKDDDDEVKSSYLAICWFTTLVELTGNNIYTNHLESHQKQFLGGFRLDLACYCVLG